MPRALLLVALLLAAPISVLADPIDDLIRAEMAKQKTPGLTVAVIQGGKVLKAEGYGLANVELQVPARRETVYQTGSVGKQFTAMLVMLLVEDGKLQLDDPIGTHLPDVPDGWRGVTVRHLLTHTGGIKEYTGVLNLHADYTEDELLRKAYSFPLDFPPGTKWSYSNTGYVVLGILASRVGGKFYGDQLKERVFTPLEMTTARIINEADIIPNRASGYRLSWGRLRNQEWVSPSLNTTADGSLYVTIDDMIKWDAALTARKLLKPASYDALWTSVKTSDGKEHGYGFGWMLGTKNGHQRIHHGGEWQGFTTYIDRYPQDEITVIVLTNLASLWNDPGVIAERIAAQLAPALAPGAKAVGPGAAAPEH